MDERLIKIRMTFTSKSCVGDIKEKESLLEDIC